MKYLLALSLVACRYDDSVPVTPDAIAKELPAWSQAINAAAGSELVGAGKPVTIYVRHPANPDFGGFTVCNAQACTVEIAPIIYHPLDAGVIHEMGHALGLKHTVPVDGEEHIMDPRAAYFLDVPTMAKQIAAECGRQGCHPIAPDVP